MKITDRQWNRYISVLRELNNKAAEDMIRYMTSHNITKTGNDFVLSEAERNALIDYAFGISTKYGEGAAAAAAEMYDAIALASKAPVPPAVPAETATMGDVAKAVNGTLKQGPDLVPSAVARQVKMAGVDTTMQNAIRDGAYWAWVPKGDTCAFCIMLASRGWQKASKNALKNGHAEHIHANCDCTYVVKFGNDLFVEGYDPQQYLDMYNNAEGTRWQDKLNSMRRQFYAENKATVGTGSVAEEFDVSKKTISDFEKRHFKDSTETGLLITGSGEEIILDGVEHHVIGDKSILNKMADGVFTHNHPTSVVFSNNDIQNGLVNGNLKEMRAVTFDGDIHVILNNGASLENRRKLLTFFSQERRKANNSANNLILRGQLNGADKEAYINKRLENWLLSNAGKYGFTYKKEKL